MAKKESDRLKLTAEFPLLFANKPVGNKVTNTNTQLNKKVTCTPNKRKSTFEDKNDENNGSIANKMVAKQTIQVSKTPLSSKKQRKGSMLSPKPQTMKVAGNLSSTLPARLQPVAPLAPAGPVENKVVIAAESPVSHDNHMDCATEGQSGVEMLEIMAPPVRKPLFQDNELEQATSTSSRSSLSSLGESIVGDLAASGDSEEVAVQEQVLDVLDYLLELDEVDEQTYRRMSSQAFSAKTLKRLSMTMQPSAAPVVVPVAAETVSAEGDVPMESAYPAQQEDCVIGELDVLNALRNYLSSAINQAPVETIVAMEECPTETEAVLEMTQPASDSTEAVESVPEYQSLSEDAGRLSSSSARSSTSSASIISDRPQWSDAASCTGSDRSSLDTVTSCPTMRVSFSTNTRRQSSLTLPPPEPLPKAEEKTISEETPLVETVVVAAPDVAPVSAPVPVPAPVPVKTVMTYPMAELLDDALMRGLVVSNITRRLEMGNHTKYILETQVLHHKL